MIRAELTYYEGVFVVAIYATDGRVLGRGHGSTEEGARYSAALDLVERTPVPTPSRRRRVSRDGSAPCRRTTAIEHSPRSAPMARFVRNAARFGTKPGGGR